MPDTRDLENPKFEESSIVYSEDQVEIDRYFRKNRQWVHHDDLSPHLINAVIATEDHRYFSHSGIDAYGLARASFFLGTKGGASTIPQQLAKQFYTATASRNPIKRIWQKMKEWVIAAEFERRYTKEEILAMFLNKFEFNHQANGVGAAAKIYFGKDQKDLTLPEAAMLVGMLKSPSIYSPIDHPERALRRRNTVLGQMKRNNYITEEQLEHLKQEPLDMSSFNKGENYGGMAPYFMAELKKHVRKVLGNNGITKPGGEKYDLDVDGLNIYTTIDTRYQRHAETAMKKHMLKQQKVFEKSWKGKDPWTYLEDDVKNKERQLQIRDAQISRQVEQTSLYANIRSTFLNEITKTISDAIPDVRLWDGDIKRLLRAEKDKGYLDKLINDDFIRKDQKVVYDKILASSDFTKLKKQWGNFKKKVKVEMNRSRPMTLYSYEGPVQKTMTPIDSIKYMNMFLQFGSISIEPKTGYVKTWVGGTDFNVWKYDHVNAHRQVGSTFKPFLYTTAISKVAMPPCRKVMDTQYTISDKDPGFSVSDSWSPKNSRGTFSEEEVTIKDALKLSLNSISVWLLKEIGSVDPLVEIASAMGLNRSRIPVVPSIILGTPEVSAMELTAAYATFANNGISIKPVFIKRIEYQGVVIYESQVEQKRAISEEVNFAMVDLLIHAASSRAYALKTKFGGKTGTTNDHVDGWFVGITPDLVTGTWVGGDQSWIRYLTLTLGQGGQMARPYFIDFMQRIESDNEINFNTNATFNKPLDNGIIVDCDLYEGIYNHDKKEDHLGDEFDEELDEINE